MHKLYLSIPKIRTEHAAFVGSHSYCSWYQHDCPWTFSQHPNNANTMWRWRVLCGCPTWKEPIRPGDDSELLWGRLSEQKKEADNGQPDLFTLCLNYSPGCEQLSIWSSNRVWAFEKLSRFLRLWNMFGSIFYRAPVASAPPPWLY